MRPEAEGLSFGSMNSASQTVGWSGSVQAMRWRHRIGNNTASPGPRTRSFGSPAMVSRARPEYGVAPATIVTDKLGSYNSALRELGIARRHDTGRWKNNRAENSASAVCYGSKDDDLCVTESRPLHPTQRTNAEASLNVCVGPKAVAWSKAGSESRRTDCDRLAHARVPIRGRAAGDQLSGERGEQPYAPGIVIRHGLQLQRPGGAIFHCTRRAQKERVGPL